MLLKNIIKNQITALFAATILLLTLTSCGIPGKNILPNNINLVHIKLFSNLTELYNIESELANSLIKEFIMDGRLEAVEPETADAILSGKITKYSRSVVRQDNSGQALDYRVRIYVDFTLKERKSGKIIASEQSFTTHDVIEYSDITDSETEAQFRAIKALAYDILIRVLEGY